MLTQAERQQHIETIKNFPPRLTALVKDLTPPQLTTHYLDGEWTVAQNVHHLADSHMNSYFRLKIILTQDHPTLVVYDQEVWAKLPEAASADLSYSLRLLEGLHERWSLVLESLSEADWARTGHHPEIGPISLDDLVKIYGDHCETHIDQITRTLAAGGIEV